MIRLLLAALLLLGLAPAAHAQELTLSVAISMREAVQELGRAFTATRPGVILRYNFGASVDLFISAATRQMDELEKRGLVVAATRRAFARNLLTVVKPADSRVDLVRSGDLLDARVGRVVIGNPKTVPAGQYAEESLRALGLWERLR